jgi:predicted TIM-barrel fold metal-dependent hydrolase
MDLVDMSRRRFFSGLTAAGAAAALPRFTATAQAGGKVHHHGVIDTHHHFWAPEYLKVQDDWEDAHKLSHHPGMQRWSPGVSLEQMDRSGVHTALLSLASISQAFWGLDSGPADRAVRASIDFAQRMMGDHPGRFGLFAPLSMIDRDSSLAQIEYALDQAKADGIGLQSSYGDKFPGDPFFNPVWEELNRRGTIVYLHGPSPACCSGLNVGPAVSPPVIEVPFDMTRAAVSLLVNGTLVRYPHIRWILSYGGGTLPFVAGRINAMVNGSMKAQGLKPADIAPDGVHAAFSRLFYDTVNVTDEPSWRALAAFVKPTQILYGTDYPYFGESQLAEIDQRVTSAAEKEMILSGNAKRLLPRLAKG